MERTSESDIIEQDENDEKIIDESEELGIKFLLELIDLFLFEDSDRRDVIRRSLLRYRKKLVKINPTDPDSANWRDDDPRMVKLKEEVNILTSNFRHYLENHGFSFEGFTEDQIYNAMIYLLTQSPKEG